MSDVGERRDPWAGVNLGSLSLVVAWRKGRKLESARIPITVSVADEFRIICREVLANLDDLEERPWFPDAMNEQDEYLMASMDQLGPHSQVLDVVRSEEFNILRPATLPQQEFVFYALIAGPASRRVAFIRKYNIRRGLRQRLITLFGDTLTKIDDLVFTFDNKADVVIDPARGAAILGLAAFQLLFRTSPEMLTRTPEYVAEIADHLPMSGGAMVTLADVAIRNMNVQRRLQAITLRGHLRGVSMGRIEDEMKKHGLDADRFIVDGELVFDQADVKDILKLLNEDLFRGGLTNQDFQVDRKSPRR